MIGVDCLAQIQFWYRLCLAILVLFGLLFVMLLNYNLKLGDRTAKLEKKNGKELAEIERLKKKLAELENKENVK